MKRQVSKIPNCLLHGGDVYLHGPHSHHHNRLNRPMHKYNELTTDWRDLCIRHDDEWQVNQVKISLFITRARLAFFLFFVTDETPLARLRPPPRRLPIRFCTDSVRSLDTISLGISSCDLFSAMSVRILPPVRNILRTTSLLRAKVGVGPTERDCRKKLPIPCPRCW